MNNVEKEVVLHCLKSMIDEELCEECPSYGTTGTDHCEKDCVRYAINALEQESHIGKWIVHPNGIFAHLVCDKCLSNAPYDIRTNYCPNCGARMLELNENK